MAIRILLYIHINYILFEQGDHRGSKLLEHVMKVLERIVEGLVREKVNIDDMQFGFIPGHGTTDAIYLMRQLKRKLIHCIC